MRTANVFSQSAEHLLEFFTQRLHGFDAAIWQRDVVI